MAQRVMENPKIKVMWDTKPEEIIPDEDGKVTGISISNLKTGDKSDISCRRVHCHWSYSKHKCFEEVLSLDENGYLIPETGSSVLTSVPGVYVAGDCADHVYRQAITAAGMGCQAAIEAEGGLRAARVIKCVTKNLVET